ncbi:hypothetical protein DFJ74DRAFT_739638 [Hyaloraphidium curvatum]|nr:hypothetical protein DFJ74DRAFT_739638 [Hyaloraphidium curvatum]
MAANDVDLRITYKLPGSVFADMSIRKNAGSLLFAVAHSRPRLNKVWARPATREHLEKVTDEIVINWTAAIFANVVDSLSIEVWDGPELIKTGTDVDHIMPIVRKRLGLDGFFGVPHQFDPEVRRFCSFCNVPNPPTVDGNGKFKRCQRCKAVVYCSKECQRLDWAEHRNACGSAPAQ